MKVSVSAKALIVVTVDLQSFRSLPPRGRRSALGLQRGWETGDEQFCLVCSLSDPSLIRRTWEWSASGLHCLLVCKVSLPALSYKV